MIDLTTELHFFIGKGGVGKSTLAALTALSISDCKKPAQLVSMDPAHNQSDIFGCRLSSVPQRVHPYLDVAEINCDQWIRKYLKDTQNHLKDAYRYQEAFNLHGYFDILQFAPGLEEYALLLAFEQILQTAGDSNIVILDMPPTALSLKFFSLPFLSLLWLEALLKLRRDICAAKKIISRIRFGRTTVEQDKVKARLGAMIDNHRLLCDRFRAPSTHIHLVVNPEPLSLSEAVRIRSKLDGLGLAVDRIMVNKTTAGSDLKIVQKSFQDRSMTCYPLSPERLCGAQALTNYLKNRAYTIQTEG